MTPIDDIKKGDYVAVVTCKEMEIVCSGLPLEVLSMSLPFLLVNDGKQTFAIDVRVIDVQRFESHYVKTARKALGLVPSVKPKTKAEPPDSRICPRCGERMRLLRAERNPQWIVVCPNCDYQPPTLCPVDHGR